MMKNAHPNGLMPWPRIIAAYGFMVLFIAAGWQFIPHHFVSVMPAAHDVSAAKPVALEHPLAIILIVMVAVMGLGRIFGTVLGRMGQPTVIGEVAAGIVLGPTVLGVLWPDATHLMSHASVAGPLGMMSQVGIVLYMFLIGLEVNHKVIRQYGRLTVVTAHASIVVPFVLAMIAAPMLLSYQGPQSSAPSVFALCLGITLSVTALPVLSRILEEREIIHTKLGNLALTCAAADDVTAWCILALLLAFVGTNWTVALQSLALLGVVVCCAILTVRPAATRLAAAMVFGDESKQLQALTVLLMMIFACAAATEWIGIHAVFGGFLVGSLIPHNSPLVNYARARLENLVLLVFLPLYFAYSGLKTDFSGMSLVRDGLPLLALIVIATVGKVGGTAVAARWGGVPIKDSIRLGVLMNARGLMALVMVNIGQDLGIISPAMHAMLVVVALVTTAMTPLGLQVLGNPHEVS